jgi:outer membrane receptor protein involved in Fe transport
MFQPHERRARRRNPDGHLDLSLSAHAATQRDTMPTTTASDELTPTVGITVDDVPFGGSSGGDYFVPDLDLGDLQRIEVLRGPQGTLYGASSTGGLLKFVTLDPSTEALSGRAEAGTDGVYNGAQLGYNFRGAVNVPVTDDLPSAPVCSYYYIQPRTVGLNIARQFL